MIHPLHYIADFSHRLGFVIELVDNNTLYVKNYDVRFNNSLDYSPFKQIIDRCSKYHSMSFSIFSKKISFHPIFSFETILVINKED